MPSTSSGFHGGRASVLSLAALASLLSFRTAQAVCTEMIPEDVYRADEATRDRYFLEKYFREATLVIQARVKEVSPVFGQLKAVLEPIAVFKSDGRPVEYAFLPVWECGPVVAVGGTYVLYGHRSVVATLNDRTALPAIATDNVTDISDDERSARMLSFLRSLTVVWVQN